MQDRIDELIRNAKPQVDPAARERIRGHVGAYRGSASRLGSLVGLLRAAALVALALGSGIAAAVWNSPRPADLSQETERVAELEQRVNELAERSPMAQVEDLKARLDDLEPEAAIAGVVDEAIENAVAEAMEQRQQRELEQWRDRHLRYTRARWERHTAQTITELREESGLTEAQEAEVRELLDAQGRKAEALIAETYRPGHHRLHRGFAQLSTETDEKLAALLEEQRRQGVEAPRGVLAADPEDWAPSDDFEDDSDIDAWVYWMNQTTKQE